MGDWRRATCKKCGARRDDVGQLTWHGLCITCANQAVEENVAQMLARSGPNFDRWRRSMAACVGGVLLDDRPPSA